MNTYRSWPLWARVAAPVSLVVIVLSLGIRLGSPRQAAAPSPTTAAPVTTAPPTTVPPTTAPPTTAPPQTAPPPTAPPTTAPPTIAAPRPAPAPAPAPSAASYPNCAAARAAGVAPLHRGDPGYAPRLDRDDDGVACES